MAEGNTARTLAIKIVPKLDAEEFARELQAALAGQGVNGSVVQRTNTNSGGNGSGGTTSGRGGDDDDPKEESKKSNGRDMRQEANIYNAIHTVGATIFTVLQKSFGIVQQLYGKVKQSSQFLQTVENLFSLAMNLLIMPLGNAIATVILPAMTDLVENVVALWDEMESIFDEGGSGSLGKLLDFILDKGMKQFALFFDQIADTLDDNSGIIGSLAELMRFVSTFLERGIEPVLKAIFSITQVVVEHFAEFVKLYVLYKGMELGATMGSSIPMVGSLVGGVIGGTVGYGATDSIMTALGLQDKSSTDYAKMGVSPSGLIMSYYATGGYVPATDGGRLAVIGEGGEGEYVVPESKAEQFASRYGGGSGGSTYITINGATTDELKEFIREFVDDQVRQSRYRSGY